MSWTGDIFNTEQPEYKSRTNKQANPREKKKKNNSSVRFSAAVTSPSSLEKKLVCETDVLSTSPLLPKTPDADIASLTAIPLFSFFLRGGIAVRLCVCVCVDTHTYSIVGIGWKEGIRL